LLALFTQKGNTASSATLRLQQQQQQQKQQQQRSTQRRTESNRDFRESLLPTRVEIHKTHITVVETMPISTKKGGAFFGFNAMSTALHLAMFCILIGLASHLFDL
jgi:hypothetical protein